MPQRTTDSCIFHEVVHFTNGHEHGVQLHKVDRSGFIRPNSFDASIALTALHPEFHFQGVVGRDRRDRVIRRDDFHFRGKIETLSGHIGRSLYDQSSNLRLGGMAFQNDLFQVQQDVEDIFTHPWNSRKLMGNPCNPDAGNGGPFKVGQQNPTQGISHRRTLPPL